MADTAVRPAQRLQVQRTRSHVIAHATALLAESGYERLNYTVLAERARVSRQTLYSHWPKPDALLRDMLADSRERLLDGLPEPKPGTAARGIVREFLIALRTAMQAPEIAAPYALVFSNAEYDPASGESLAGLSSDLLSALNAALAGSRISIDQDEFSTLAGAVLSARFFRNAPIDDTQIDFLVESWWAARAARARRQSRAAS